MICGSQTFTYDRGCTKPTGRPSKVDPVGTGRPCFRGEIGSLGIYFQRPTCKSNRGDGRCALCELWRRQDECLVTASNLADLDLLFCLGCTPPHERPCDLNCMWDPRLLTEIVVLAYRCIKRDVNS